MSEALLDHLLAEYIVPATPAKAANPANREHRPGLVADCVPCEGLRISAISGRGAGPDAQASQSFAADRKPESVPQSEQRQGFSQDSQDSQDSQGGPAPCTDPDRGCWPHSDAMNGAELQAFADRCARLMRWGWAEADAEALAERLVKRDRDQDDRVSCTDCRHYRLGRCGNHERAGLTSAEVGRDLAALLQRCAGFDPIGADR